MKIEFKITDDAGNVQQYVVIGSLPAWQDIINESNKKWIHGDDEMPTTVGEVASFRRGASWMKKMLTGNDR